jgi:3-hydroxyisobutyrate dehydrogenase-like beta-hydroxyacid dehydrogenase
VTLAVAVLGLGEAGGTIASGLAARGCAVRGWDPDAARVAPDVERATTPTEGVAGAELVLSLATAAHALDAATSVVSALGPAHLYADLNTTAPALKREVAAAVAPTGAAFADVALLGGVPAQGVETPALASGDGAARFAELVRPLGMPVELVGAEPGEAAGLKLLRSVFMKGLAAAVLESMEAATRRNADDWLRGEAAEVIGEPLLERLLAGSVRHAERRRDEMDAAAAYLRELGVEPRISEAAAGWLGQLAEEQRTRPA